MIPSISESARKIAGTIRIVINRSVSNPAASFLLFPIFFLMNLYAGNVAKGVLGVAIIQSILLGIIFILAGVPYAGLWALLCLFFAVIQVGPIVVTIPVIIYLFASIDPWLAFIWTILIVLASLLDNFLKPILMGKGAPVPMLVIFLGAIGGFIASGFIGLFIGAIILSLGYKLYLGWLEA
ncbi:hypothetical protein ES708_26609 [subsurface metagenome]